LRRGRRVDGDRAQDGAIVGEQGLLLPGTPERVVSLEGKAERIDEQPVTAGASGSRRFGEGLDDLAGTERVAEHGRIGGRIVGRVVLTA